MGTDRTTRASIVNRADPRRKSVCGDRPEPPQWKALTSARPLIDGWNPGMTGHGGSLRTTETTRLGFRKVSRLPFKSGPQTLRPTPMFGLLMNGGVTQPQREWTVKGATKPGTAPGARCSKVAIFGTAV